jgi:protein involved in polysaccharide export with SLBB domain
MKHFHRLSLAEKPSIFFLMITAFFADFAAAQDPFTGNQQFYNAALSKPAVGNEAKAELTVDPAVYTTGPGDVIEVRCSKTPWVRYSGTVNESGVLYFAEFGAINVGKKSLSDARADIVATVSKSCRTGEIDVTLVSPKKVEVIVVGEGINSGSYRLDGTLRILDAIKLALKDPALLNTSVNLRQVTVTIQRNTMTYDVAKFIASGISAANPYLYPGSIISVAPAIKWVTVSGAVSSALPSDIPFRENETIGDILSMFKFSIDADSSNIVLLRNNVKPTHYKYPQIAALSAENLDHIVVGLIKPRQHPMQAAVKGEIKNPGVYPINPGVTTARQLIALAGGLTDLGDGCRAYISRKNPLPPTPNKLAEGLATIRPETNLSVRHMLSSGDYRIIPLEICTNDFLENGDEIIIPEISRSVFISGYVKQPGAYQYCEGEGLSYYIKLAGGWIKNSDKANTTVVAVYGDSWAVKESGIRPGDVILVPEKAQEKKLQLFDVCIRSVYYVSLAVLALLQINDKLHFFQTD